MTLKVFAVEELIAIRTLLNTVGQPTHTIMERIDQAIDAVHEYGEKAEKKPVKSDE